MSWDIEDEFNNMWWLYSSKSWARRTSQQWLTDIGKVLIIWYKEEQLLTLCRGYDASTLFEIYKPVRSVAVSKLCTLPMYRLTLLLHDNHHLKVFPIFDFPADVMSNPRTVVSALATITNTQEYVRIFWWNYLSPLVISFLMQIPKLKKIIIHNP